MPEFYKIKEAAEILKITPKTLNRLHIKGKITFLEIGGRHRISREELERFIKAGSTPRRDTAEVAAV